MSKSLLGEHFLPIFEARHYSITGPWSRFTGAAKGEVMRIPDEIRGCVCFIEARRPNGKTSSGTAFFITVPKSLPGGRQLHFAYVVIAKHCVLGKKQDNAKYGAPTETVLLAN